jgi:glycerate dehydrogenase
MGALMILNRIMIKKNVLQKFKCLVIIDPIILSTEQWIRLSNKTDTLYYFPLHSDNNSISMDTAKLNNLVEINKLDSKQQNILLRECEAIITCWTPISDDLILYNNNICYIGFWTHCIDSKINLELAQERNITVTYIPDYGTDAVAEMTIAGILFIQRKISNIKRDTLNGKWPYEYLKTGSHVSKFEEIPSRSLTNKILGIVGFGRIGQRVAEIAQAFKMHVKYYSTSRHLSLESKGIMYRELDEIFSSCDIITLHLPQNAPEKMIDKKLIQLMKNGSIFVNTSSGKLVDEKALFDELKSRRIYAYLDVYEGLPPRKKLKELNTLNNLFTYRAAWFTKESVFQKGELLIKNIEGYLKKLNEKNKKVEAN